MPIKRGGGKPANAVKANSRNLREEAFMVTGKRNTPRYFDIQADMADATTSHNGVVKTANGTNR